MSNEMSDMTKACARQLLTDYGRLHEENDRLRTALKRIAAVKGHDGIIHARDLACDALKGGN